MKKLAYILAIVLLIPAGASALNFDAGSAAKLDDRLLEAVEAAPADSIFDVLISTGAPDASVRRLAASATTVKSRYLGVAPALHSKAARNQATLVRDFDNGSLGTARLVKRFWVADMVRVKADRDDLMQLARRGDVVRITSNATVELIEPMAASQAPSLVTGASASLDAIGAHSVWASGLTGRGRLVASIDTGVEGIHPALMNNWRGRNGDTAAAWYDPYGDGGPVDNNGHGTHVMGIMVGHADGDTIGLAPEAEWISAAVIDRGSSLATTISDILDALQWVADPDGNPQTTDDVPDVVCNSWGISQQIVNPCDGVFFEAIDNVEAMGIVCIFAAGNEGPNSMTIRNPADHASSPTSTFSVGAVDQTISGYPVPSFSSRGPSACDGISIKPEIAAPGVAIRSAYRGQTYRLINGTSMAAPHVAAAVAILRQYNPNLTPEEIKQIILSTARDIGDPGEDNESGHGLIDLPAALAAATPATLPDVELSAVSVPDAHDALLSPGETAPLTMAITGQFADLNNLTGTLRALTPGVTTSVDVAWYGSVPAGESVENTASPFIVTIDPTVAVGDSLRFELVLSGDPLLGPWTETISLLCGMPGGGAVATVTDGAMSLSLSNFGQIGVGPNSQLNAGGIGWTEGNAGNILYETALVLTTADGGFSDASRGSALDFRPTGNIGISTNPAGTIKGRALFDDSRSISTLGVSVEQTVTMSTEFPLGKFAVVEWAVTNNSGSPISGLQCGIVTDIDLPLPNVTAERIIADPATGGFYHTTEGGTQIAGIAPLSGPFATERFFQNPALGLTDKRTLSRAEKIQALQPGIESPGTAWGDAFAIVGPEARTLADGATLRFAVAFIIAGSSVEFAQAASDAERLRAGYTDVTDGEDDAAMVPRAFLAQNYPNPFNPETVISFTLPQDGNVSLEVFNLLGQNVRTLASGWNPAGQKTVVWDGSDRNGRQMASGMYFYRLQTDYGTITRQMVLVR